MFLLLRRRSCSGIVSALLLLLVLQCSKFSVASGTVATGKYFFDDATNKIENNSNKDMKNGPVIEIKQDDYFERVGFVKPRLVLFYMPSCAACQEYKQTYIEVATLVNKKLGRSTDIRTLAVSCEAHPSLCKKAEVSSHPSVKLTLDNGKTWKSLSTERLSPRKVEEAMKMKARVVTDTMKERKELSNEKVPNNKREEPNKDLPVLKSQNKVFTAMKKEETREVMDTKKERKEQPNGPMSNNKRDESKKDLPVLKPQNKDLKMDQNIKQEKKLEQENRGARDPSLASKRGLRRVLIATDEEADDDEDNDLQEIDDEEKEDNNAEEDEDDADDDDDDENEDVEDETKDITQDEAKDMDQLDEEDGDDEESDTSMTADVSEDEDGSNESVGEDNNDESDLPDASDNDEDGDDGDDTDDQNDEDENTDEEDDDDEEDDEEDDDEDDDEDEEEDEEEDDHGAARARQEGIRTEVPELREQIEQQLKKLGPKRGRGGIFVRNANAKKNLNFETHHLKQQQPNEGATSSMIAYKPNTKEFQERRNSILDAIERKKGYKVRQKVEHRWKAIERSQGNLRLPYKKDIISSKPKFLERIPLVKRTVRMLPEESLMLDTSISFMRGLRGGIYKNQDHGPLSKERRIALKDWLELLSATLPEEWGLHDTIDDLMDRFEFICEKENNLLQVLDDHKMIRRHYSASCAGDLGFSCGFWKLLHTVSIGLAQHRGGQTLIESGLRKPSARVFPPSEAAAAVRDYMANFYLNESFGNKFVETYEQCRNRLCVRMVNNVEFATEADWKEMAKWLWEVHNDVSVRKVHEEAFRQRDSKRGLFGRAQTTSDIAVLFPSMEACVKCFKSDGSWDEEAVFLFLEYEYWPSLSFDRKMNRLLKFEEGFDPEGAGLFWVLIFIGIIMLFVLNHNKNALQQTILAAKSASLNVRQAGAMAAPKRTD